MAELDTIGQIKKCLDGGASFVVEAGAGSGKTRALVDTIRYVIDSRGDDLAQANQRIACITYTNVAKDEIRSRLNDHPLVVVDTIHEFLWSVIADYQDELKAAILAQNAVDTKKPIENLHELLATVRVSYGQFGRHFDRGEIFHDDVLSIASSLFETYPKISRIAAERFPYLFVDEYQDTASSVVGLLTTHFVEAPRPPVVGFYGDSMQQIYQTGIGSIPESAGLTEITKVENYRCSVAVIDVLNRIRPALQQVPAGNNAQGEVHLLTSSGDPGASFGLAMTLLGERGWTAANTKVLVLTHKGIAREVGYAELLRVFSTLPFGTDRLMKREDAYGEFFEFVESLCESYGRKDYGEFLSHLGKAGYRLSAHSQKQALLDYMETLAEKRLAGTIGDMLAFLDTTSFISKPSKLVRLENELKDTDDPEVAKKLEFHQELIAIPYSEVVAFMSYVNDNTPFSTKHGVKGAEFENVLVVIDDSLWTQYKFADVFTHNASNAVRLERSTKLLYVCFSRAIHGLAVLSLTQLDPSQLAGASDLLGVAPVDLIS